MPRFCRPYVFIPQRCAARAEQGGTAPSQPQQMPQCGHGMMPQHARPGIAHDAAHPLAHLGTVTMNGTVLAVGLPLTMRAARKTQHGIVKQFVTRRAQFLVPLGMAAIEADHLRHRALLAADARRIAAPASRHCIFRFSPHANSVTTSSFLLHTLGFTVSQPEKHPHRPGNHGTWDTKIRISSRRTASPPVNPVTTTVLRGRLTVFPPSPTASPGQQWPHFPHLHVATRRRLHPYGATATFSFPGVWKKPMTSPFFMYVRLVGQTRRKAILPVFPLDYREKHWLTAQFFVTLPRFSGKLTPY